MTCTWSQQIPLDFSDYARYGLTHSRNSLHMLLQLPKSRSNWIFWIQHIRTRLFISFPGRTRRGIQSRRKDIISRRNARLGQRRPPTSRGQCVSWLDTRTFLRLFEAVLSRASQNPLGQQFVMVNA